MEPGCNLHGFEIGIRYWGLGAVAILVDLKLVAISGCTEIQSWEPQAGRCVHKLNQPAADSLTFSSDSKFLASMRWSQYTAQFWDTATGVSLFHAEAGSADSMPFFDPDKGDILTNRFIYKNSSWKQWHKLPCPGYSQNGSWICLDGQETVFIPPEFSPGREGEDSVSSDSLVAYTSITDQVIIIKFPDSQALNTNASYSLVDENISRDTAKRKRLK